MQTVTLNLDHLEKDPNPTHYSDRLLSLKALQVAASASVSSASSSSSSRSSSPAPSSPTTSLSSLSRTSSPPPSGLPLRLIFLDVDGVLNTADQRLATSIHPVCLRNFAELVLRTDSYIVISSTWRKHRPFMNKLMTCLKQHDVDERVIGKTPQIAPFERPAEIMSWLDVASRQYGLDVASWVALDDMPLEEMDRSSMGGRCVLTTIQAGLCKKHVRMAEELLHAQEAMIMSPAGKGTGKASQQARGVLSGLFAGN